MENLSAIEAKEQLFELIHDSTTQGKQYTITSEAGSVVVLPQETYDNIVVTLELLSTPGLLDHIDFQNASEREGRDVQDADGTSQCSQSS